MTCRVAKLVQPEEYPLSGAAQRALREAMAAVGPLQSVVIVTWGADGTFSARAVWDESNSKMFDAYGRAEAVCSKQKMSCLE